MKLEEGLEVEVLWPDRLLDLPRAEDQGLVLRIGAGTNRIMWAGDISEKVEAILLERGTDLRADVLIQGEHSQQRNLSRGWLVAVGPKDLIRPRQGYDVDRSLTPQFWELAVELRMRVWLMDQTGAMIFRATGDRAVPVPFLGAKPLP
jgi:beta-lactamase superfamily II metal-dependent hydrolase